jgi:hypothetical protein
LLHVSTRVESSSGRELKEQIYFFLDIESGVFVCVSCGGEIALFFHFIVFYSVGW